MNFNDLTSLEHILNDFDDFWTYNVLLEEFNSDISKYIVAKIDNTIVVFAGIKLILDEAELMNIVTRKDFRNAGIASNMLEYIISLCKTKKIKILNLEVDNLNSIAINLYKKYNFKQVGIRKNYYNGNEDAILMSLVL